jgi:muconolactone delta-isomerase
MKFLVLWELELRTLGPVMVKSIAKMPEYAKNLNDKGKLYLRYHMVGRHGGAWIYEVDSNEELERLLAASPVYNYAHFQVFPLAEMDIL